MAARVVAIIAGLSVAGLVIGPVIAVLLRAETFSGFGPADWQALRFTLVQALLSAALSVLFAIPLARALARRRFVGRGLLVALLGAPFILPVIVAVLGLLAVFGQSGLLNRVLSPLGAPQLQIYGLQGVLVAHVFFNLPLATRLFLQGWLAVPGEQFRLAASLGMGPRAMWRAIEWPLLKRIAPGAFAVIFVICLSSFAVALTLGGGPRATTLELAIYQSVRFDFDLGRAAALGLVQLALALAAGLVALRVASVPVAARGLDRMVPRWDGQGKGARMLDGVWIVVAAVFLLIPLAMVVLNGASGILTLGGSVWVSAAHSLAVALGSTVLCLAWALPLTTRWGEWLGLSGIALSPLVLGIGLFLIVRPFTNPFELALYVTATVNAFVSLPFVLRILRPEAEAIRADYGRLGGALGLSDWAWLRWVLLPRLKRPLGFAAGLTAALSMGDLGVIALFADPDRATLPLKIYQLMGAYRMEQAAGGALLLLLLSLSLFWAFDRGGRVGA
ncbi:thiamine/thiamine pyrophosphate ABC transporter permease ThiP [Marivita sp. GX14005]|uniref:thiamine/thiamine pyrophosphate ABC transporter permease ThiP n=1 Tax=Marivita sp. GX14005 TaxID=2942276 RepID=UPI002018569F|nr:thiamine/thiamine pyrophosphate ABC transporter permease ThiP [Marivita sp. GX14005]MCL3881922.1 thiamine/thiamine pyrophosphate ABC transporter permease ThiP [Marivita sp. GX14005]